MAKTKLLTRSMDYRITMTMGDSSFIGQKVRIALTKQEELIPLDAEGYMVDLQGYMLGGPRAGCTVELPPCKLTTANVRKCPCSAYKFPHAPGFGECQQPKFEQTAPEGMTLNDLKELF